jgi:hypothetical protein
MTMKVFERIVKSAFVIIVVIYGPLHSNEICLLD